MRKSLKKNIYIIISRMEYINNNNYDYINENINEKIIIPKKGVVACKSIIKNSKNY